MDELWKPIKNYEHRYEISNLGKVKSVRRNIILKCHSTKTGYVIANLYNNEKITFNFVFYLVSNFL